MAKELSELDKVLIDTIKGVSNVTGDIYSGVKSTTITAIDFAKQQIPDVINQLLLYNLAQSILLVLLSLVMMYSAYYTYKKFYEHTEDLVVIYGVVVSPIAFTMFLINMNDVLKITLAPKLYLLEYVSRLMK